MARTHWQALHLLQLRTRQAPALPGLAIHVSSHGYQLHPCISWESGEPVIETWALYRPGRKGSRVRLRFVRYCANVKRGKESALSDLRTRRARARGRADGVER